jgi:4-amino-4-deoxy-L-arabinose transferase-like glycosyltransferase
MAVQGSSRSRTELLWMAAIIVVAIALRFVSLGADPMQELSGGFISDEGTWWKNPRLHAVFGQWMVDDGNYGILTAPAYTLVMRGVFALLGVGYVQAYTASAVSGLITLLLVYFLVRREAGATAAVLAAAFVGINALTVPYDRSAYPESFQLMMMTATIATILTCRGRAWLAALGGVFVVIVLLSKPPGIVLAPIATATWGAVWLMDRQTARAREFSWSALFTYAGVAAAILAVVGVVYLRPYAADVWTHFQIQMSDGAIFGAAMTDRLLLFGTRAGFRLNDFFRSEWYLIVVTALFGAARIARVTRRPLTTVEIAAWIWVVMGFGVMALQSYQVDRRFLFLIPPMAMLAGIAASQAFEVGESAWTSPRARRIGTAAAAAVLALVLLFYVIPFGVWKMIGVGRMLGRTWTYGVAGGLLLSAMVLGVTLLAAWRVPQVRFRGRATPQIALMALPVLFALFQVSYEIAHLGRGLETASQTIGRISTLWPNERVAAAGWPAGTLTMGSRVLPVNHETKGPTAAERFRPQLELYAATPGKPLKQNPFWAVPGRPQKVDCAQLPIWTDPKGKPRLVVHIFVEPDRLAGCQALVREQAAQVTVSNGR